jgi:lysophospholipase L1-like esterase
MVNKKQEAMKGEILYKKNTANQVESPAKQQSFITIQAKHIKLLLVILCFLCMNFAGCNTENSQSNSANITANEVSKATDLSANENNSSGNSKVTTAEPTKTDAGLMIDGLVYPTNFDTFDTPKAGILNLCAFDIPRYTQTGPLPDPAPEQHWVLPPVPHNPKLPTIWIIGDSTVRCGVNATGDDRPGQWGWGTPFVGYFNPDKVNVVNRAVGGTTTASFYTTLWSDMVDLIKKGDVLIMQFGTNSGRGELPGIGDETQESTDRNGQTVTNYTYGWYIRKFISETRDKGATPVVCSLIPRGSRNPNRSIVPQQASWARETAAAEKADFIDLHELISRKYNAMEQSEVNALFSGSPHTSWTGAVVNAETVISGLKALNNDPVADYYLPQAKEISAAPVINTTAPVVNRTAPRANTTEPARNFRGRKRRPASDNPRDQLPFTNSRPVNLNPELPTLFIAGDSTAATGNPVTRGWAALLVDYFDTNKVNLVNMAVGGARFNTYQRTWERLIAAVKPGDYVVIEFGHNSGPLPGIGDETEEIEGRGGAIEIRHTHGWYLRQFVADVRKKNAIPIVSTITPRKKWTDGKVERLKEMVPGQGGMSDWSRQVAAAEKTLLVDHTNIIADIYDKMGKAEVAKFFTATPTEYLHTNTAGAIVNAETFIAGLKALSDMPLVNMLNEKGKAIPAYKPATQPVPPRNPRPSTPSNSSSLDPELPTLFVIGDSTASNGPRAGWGDPLSDYFDPTKINVTNRAKGSRSSRSFQLEGSWDAALKDMKSGDYVLIQMGQNDGRPITRSPAKSSLPGIGEETQEVTMPNGTRDTVHTFGWYIRKYINDSKAKGATPIVMSLTAKNLWLQDGKNRRPYDNYPQWSEEVAKAENVQFLDHINIMGDVFEKIGQAETAKYFRDSTHTTEAGADLNAAGVVAGLKALNSPLVNYLSEKGKTVETYKPASNNNTQTTPITGQRRTPTRANRRAPQRQIRQTAPQSVCPRDSEPFTSEDFTSLKPNLPTLIIAGDSTANKGSDAWHRGWAAVVVDYFDTDKVNVVNRARGGRSCRSFVREGLWDQLVAAVKPGDFVMIQFGHNDGGDINNANGRPDLPGIGEDTQTVQRPDGTSEIVHTFGWYIRKFIKDVQAKGGTPVVMATTPYNRWNNDIFVYEFGRMSEWARQVAEQEKVLFLNHTELICNRYTQLGEETVKDFFPADHLHTSTLGGIVNAEMFVAGVKALDIKVLVDSLNEKGKAISYYKSTEDASVSEPSVDKANIPAITLHLAGDSTVMTYPSTTTQEGWGQELGQFFIDKLNINNQAMGGANVRSFKNGRWNNILTSLIAGDYVMMQFGANDSGTAHGPVMPDDFAATLIQMANEVKAKNANPIFVTPSAFYQWNGEKQDNNRLAPYAAAMVNTGKEQNIPVINLNARGVEYLNSIGKDEATSLYMPSRGTVDKAHFVKAGSTKMAQFIIEEIQRINSPLKAYIK